MATLPEWWTSPYPEVSSPKTAADYLNAIGGLLSQKEDDGEWVLFTGEQELMRAETEEEVDAFVLGFALAHLICETHGLIGTRPGPAAQSDPLDVDG